MVEYHACKVSKVFSSKLKEFDKLCSSISPPIERTSNLKVAPSGETSIADFVTISGFSIARKSRYPLLVKSPSKTLTTSTASKPRS